MKKERVCVIGSGNWGSTIARIVGENVKRFAEFEDTVKMWVFEEEVEGKKLTDIINTEHENVKYLPGFKIPTNVIAEADLVNAAKTATILIFVLPHQFVTTTCTTLKPHIDPKTCRAVSLIKGIDAGKQGFKLISDDIQDLLLGIDVSVLMGANIATEVAKEQFCETTIGYRVKENAVVLKRLFHTDFFRVNMVHDVAGTEICGALKNVVALAAGFVDGLGYGGNTKAAVMRIGLMEMRKFAHMFYDGVRDETFLESCGVADLITTCHGGRNRMVAEAMVTTGRGIDELEAEMLNGQKLQGSSTAQEVYELLSARGVAQEFPLLTTVYRIAYEDVPAARILVDI